jgi:hypothetical protein
MFVSLLEIVFLLWLLVGVMRVIAGLMQAALGLAGVVIVALWALLVTVVSLPLMFVIKIQSTLSR